MAKQALVTRILGRKLVPSEEMKKTPDLMERLWGMKPSADGSYVAFVEAAWIEEGNLKVLACDPFGNVKQLNLSHGFILLKGENE